MDFVCLFPIHFLVLLATVEHCLTSAALHRGRDATESTFQRKHDNVANQSTVMFIAEEVNSSENESKLNYVLCEFIKCNAKFRLEEVNITRSAHASDRMCTNVSLDTKSMNRKSKIDELFADSKRNAFESKRETHELVANRLKIIQSDATLAVRRTRLLVIEASEPLSVHRHNACSIIRVMCGRGAAILKQNQNIEIMNWADLYA